MACEMAMERESYVHFVLMGTADIEMRTLLEVNGIDKTCPLIMHGKIVIRSPSDRTRHHLIST
jgi:hypothetical protein